MTELTEEQVKEFWEWCGFTEIHHKDYWNNLYWKAPDGWEYPIIPCIDLNALFKYAVPKLKYCSLQFHGMTYVADISIQFSDHHVCSGTDPALALFWAIWEVIKK